MRLLITIGARFIDDILEKELYGDSSTVEYDRWRGYLQYFDKVTLLVRAKDGRRNSQFKYRASGERVDYISLPYYEGPWQFAKQFLAIRRELIRALSLWEEEAVIIRGPDIIGYILVGTLGEGRPYGVEVTGDPWDVFSPGAVKHILRPFLRLYFAYKLRKACRNAVAALYVTKEALQKSYPCPCGMFSASDVQLSEGDFVKEPRMFLRTKKRRLIFVGTLNQLYKAPDILIKSFKECIERGQDLSLTLLGDGKYRPSLEKLAADLGISERVSFLGMVPREEVFRKLDEADLFVLPSKTEGLPRAMLEAMARGLPCIGSKVGGIPELLPPEDLVPPGDVRALAAKIMEVIKDPERMTKMSARNLEKAREYREDVLQKEREAFYSLVKEKTEEWIRMRKGL